MFKSRKEERKHQSSGFSAGDNTPQTTPILDMLESSVLPRLEEYGMQQIAVAQPLMRDLVLPPSIRASHKRRRGPRNGVQGPRIHNSPGVIAARWPDDGQHELRVPEFVTVIAGQTDLHLGDYLLHCKEGQSIIIPPGTPKPIGTETHLEGENRINGFCDLLWLAPYGQQLHVWLCHSYGVEHKGPSFRENVYVLDDRPLHLLYNVLDEVTECRNGYLEIYNSLLRAFILTIIRDLREQRFLYLSAEIKQEPLVMPGYDPIGHARQYIQNHLYETLTLEKVARMVRMSRAQFARRFREDTGETFNQFTTRCRLERAQLFLRDTAYTIPYIRQFVGYRSEAHFHTLFQRYVGITPAEYRRQHQEKQL